MNLGMLWFDNDSTDLKTKIEKAATYYRGKYGTEPNMVFVNPKTMPEIIPNVPGFQLKSTRSVLPNHLWMGVSE